MIMISLIIVMVFPIVGVVIRIVVDIEIVNNAYCL